MKTHYWLCLTLFLLPTAGNTENKAQHPEVLAALEFQIPENRCIRPTLIDMNLLTPEMNQHMRNSVAAWLGCDYRYSNELLTGFNRLKSSAQFGLNKAQARTILAKMAGIQIVLEERQAYRESFEADWRHLNSTDDANE